MSGFEVAGIALAVFPLVISGAKFYATSIREFRSLWRLETAFSALSREIGIEETKYLNTCTVLLEDMVPASRLDTLMKNPAGPLWRDIDLEEKLAARLRPDTVPGYMDAMETLNSILEKIRDELEIDKNDPAGGLESLDRETRKRKLKRIGKVIYNNGYKDQLAEITKINSDLATLTGQMKSTAFPSQSTGSAKHYKRIRDHAINLYEVLKEKLQAAPACACTVSHSANLRLEVRGITTPLKDDRDTSLRFHVAISFGDDPATETALISHWREIGLEPVGSEKESWRGEPIEDGYNSDDKKNRRNMVSPSIALSEQTQCNPAVSYTVSMQNDEVRDSTFTGQIKSILRGRKPKNTGARTPRGVSFNVPHTSSIITHVTAQTTTERIKNLCSIVQNSTGDGSCFGVLVDESNRQYNVWPPTIPQSLQSMEVSSLDKLLAEPGVFSRLDRLVLGVQLASTVMQLHATEWLREDWGKKDIFFHQESIETKNSGTPTPFVRRIFASLDQCLPSQKIQGKKKSILIPHSQCLFSLGIVLLELWHGKRLEDFHRETDGVVDTIDLTTAMKWAGSIHESAGEKYGGAVERCIWGLGLSHKTLEVAEFKNEVQARVISPLVENLRFFCPEAVEQLCL